MKKYSKLIIGISFTVLIVIASCVLYHNFSNATLYNNLSIDSVALKKQVRITKEDTKIYQLAVKAIDGLETNDFHTIEKDYLYVNLFTESNIVYVDLLTADKTRIILCEKNNILYKYINSDQRIFINQNNHEIKEFEIPTDNRERSGNLQDTAMLDPFFENEYSILPYLPRKSTYEWIQVDYLNQAGISAQQELSVYESQFNFDTEHEMGVIYEQGTDLACIAMAQKIELQVLYEWFHVNSIELNDLQQTTNIVFFCTYKKIKYSIGRYVTCTNPISPYNGREVLLYKIQEDVQAELKYKKTYTINQKSNVISVEYIQNPEVINYCDKYYKDITIPIFNQMLQNKLDFELWDIEKVV